ncbi:hypothetical protein T440DRAFT_167151 [Plenodomus tracheiphilus IPT5]|uniref:Xylanolytic transcriptional activator regulatory domain-containing protein n=1 Tax=Plenodomus tracheiphilus IPT5 TaxID=1408161 RepID=A0A6A7AZN7_9PLEO|nr:hypothetical protein T440DRAFT_167151 [Plenodomus tracheiphilus IPT5]
MLKLVPLTFLPDSVDGSSFVASIGRYQTFDSRPLPNPNVDPLWLPDKQEMVSMLSEIRHLIQDGKDDTLSGGVCLSMSTLTTEETYRPLAFYHVCFALASSIYHANFRHSEQHTGEAYFKRARLLLGNPLDTVRFTLSDVPVLNLMGFYLIELNRRDAAYMYVSLAIHIAVIHGAFRTCHDEASNRTFWTLYILDRWLSVLMGRPPTLADEAIRLPLPRDSNAMPPSAGIRANIELAKISGHIVCETFKIAPRNQSSGSSTQNIDKALNMLENWQTQLPPELDFNSNEPSCNLLYMAQNQFIVLTTRPIFLAAVKQAVAARFHGLNWSIEQHTQAAHIIACSRAAVENLVLAQRLHRKRKFLQSGLHYLFNATVVLLLNRIASSASRHHTPIFNRHKDTTSPSEQLHTAEVSFAISVFEQESKTGTHYPKDCCQVLQDLKALVDRYLSQNLGTNHRESNMELSHTPPISANAVGHIARIGHMQMSWAGEHGWHQDLTAWKQSEGLHVQESMLI